MQHWQDRGKSNIEKAVMPFIAGFSTLVLCAAYIFANTLEIDCVYQAIVRALPAFMLAACILFHKRKEIFAQDTEKSQ